MASLDPEFGGGAYEEAPNISLVSAGTCVTKYPVVPVKPRACSSTECEAMSASDGRRGA